MTFEESLALWLSPGVLALFGLCIGSFLNVVIYRYPLMLERDFWSDMLGEMGATASWPRVLGIAQPPEAAATVKTAQSALEALPAFGLVRPRSRCGHCGHLIRWYENVPVVSWLALRGRCSACKTPISIRYPLVELTTAVLFGATAWHFGPHLITLGWCAVMALLVAMTLIDYDTTYLPDSLTQPMLWGGLVAAHLGLTGIPFQDALIGAIVGYMSLWSLNMLFKLTRGREGMGAGDFKLLAALAAWLGWKAILPIALMSSIVGVSINLPLRFLGKQDADHQIPFGPFLAGGGLVVIFVGAERCLEWIGIH